MYMHAYVLLRERLVERELVWMCESQHLYYTHRPSAGVNDLFILQAVQAKVRPTPSEAKAPRQERK